MIEIEPHSEGAILPVRARPAARTSGIRGEQDGALKVSVTQAPEKGKANKAIIAVLGKQLGLRKSQLLLLSGETSPQKKFLVRGLPMDELRRRVEASLPSTP